jgi:hypothetical protein
MREVQFSCFALSDSFWVVPRARGPVFMFYAPGLIFGRIEGTSPIFMFCALRIIFDGTEGVRSSFHVLCFWTHF